MKGQRRPISYLALARSRYPAVALAGVSALADDLRPLQDRPRVLGRVRRDGSRAHRGRRTADVRHERVLEIPPLRRAGPWLRPDSLRRLRVRSAAAVLLERAWLLSELRRPAHGRAHGASRRPRLPTCRPGAPVGALGAPSRAISVRLRLSASRPIELAQHDPLERTLERAMSGRVEVAAGVESYGEVVLTGKLFRE